MKGNRGGSAPENQQRTSVLAGFEAERQVGRAPADQAGGERHDADVTPRGEDVGNGQADENEAEDDTGDAVDAADIAFHNGYPKDFDAAILAGLWETFRD